MSTVQEALAWIGAVRTKSSSTRTEARLKLGRPLRVKAGFNLDRAGSASRPHGAG